MTDAPAEAPPLLPGLHDRGTQKEHRPYGLGYFNAAGKMMKALEAESAARERAAHAI